MPLNLPNLLTLLRIALIPVLVVVYYLPLRYAHVLATSVFVLAALTDWLDGYLARRLGQSSRFGAFLDPVADKLTVATALVLLATDPRVLDASFSRVVFAVVTTIIIGREIAISALREWMAEIGGRAHVAVMGIAKVKTTVQMVAISLLLFREPVYGLPVLKLGELLLYVAAVLTLWTMVLYLRAAWPSLAAEKSSAERGAAAAADARRESA